MNAFCIIDADTRKVTVRLEPESPSEILLLKRMAWLTTTWSMNKGCEQLECEFDDSRS